MWSLQRVWVDVWDRHRVLETKDIDSLDEVAVRLEEEIKIYEQDM